MLRLLARMAFLGARFDLPTRFGDLAQTLLAPLVDARPTPETNWPIVCSEMSWSVSSSRRPAWRSALSLGDRLGWAPIFLANCPSRPQHSFRGGIDLERSARSRGLGLGCSTGFTIGFRQSSARTFQVDLKPFGDLSSMLYMSKPRHPPTATNQARKASGDEPGVKLRKAKGKWK